MQQQPSPKLCECGCGQPAPIAKKTSARQGHVQGQPTRFRRGHTLNRHRMVPGFKGSVRDRLQRGATIDADTGCWIWQKRCDPAGYGEIAITEDGVHRKEKAHRAAYVEFVGPIPDGAEVIMHTCDNPPCVNPDHLRPGTHRDNIRDMWAKGRQSPPPRRSDRQSPSENVGK